MKDGKTIWGRKERKKEGRKEGKKGKLYKGGNEPWRWSKPAALIGPPPPPPNHKNRQSPLLTVTTTQPPSPPRHRSVTIVITRSLPAGSVIDFKETRWPQCMTQQSFDRLHDLMKPRTGGGIDGRTTGPTNRKESEKETHEPED
jgi:hypothetical protein